MKRIFMTAAIGLWATMSHADGEKYSGNWAAPEFGQISASVQFKGENDVTYCFNYECFDVTVEGDINRNFNFHSGDGLLEFLRGDDNRIAVKFTRNDGKLYLALFDPE